MIHLEFLLEERSMKEMLSVLLPKFIDEEVTYRLHPHQGKQDLKRSILRSARGFSHIPNIYLVIIIDQDASDCRQLKQELLTLSHQDNAPKPFIRIVCRELEAWLLGDLQAVEHAYPKSKASKFMKKAKFRQPDQLGNAAEELSKLTKDRGKIRRASKIAENMELDRNSSQSFQIFVKGLQEFIQKLKTTRPSEK